VPDPFAWSNNNKKKPILVKVDRILVSGIINTLANVRMLFKSGTDHNSLRVKFGGEKQVSKKNFRFKKLWLK
jgi:hypothetical protein